MRIGLIFAILILIPVYPISGSETVTGLNGDVDPKYSPSIPFHESVNQYAAIIPPDGDEADIFYLYPSTFDQAVRNQTYPVALLLQGANVDKSYYSQFARLFGVKPSKRTTS